MADFSALISCKQPLNRKEFGMRRIFCFAVSILFLAAALTAFGADFWEKKEFNKWSQKDCSKMLTNSPWAKDVTIMDSGLQRSTRTSDDGQQLYVKYQVQFRSALPVRQARSGTEAAVRPKRKPISFSEIR